MIDKGKHDVLGIQVDAVDYSAAVARIMEAVRQRRSYGVTALAVHGLVTASRDALLKTDVNSMDLVTPDGQPVRWALNHLHHTALKDRVYGPDLTLKLLAACAQEGFSTYFYGSTDDVIDHLVTRMTARFPGLRVAGVQPSRFRMIDHTELQFVAEEIVSSSARICFVGLGCPRQEIFASAIRAYLPMPVIAVGAAFDFHSGLSPQAPPWMQARGLEWTYRLSREPGRLWRRYLVTNCLFLILWAKQSLRRDASTAPPARSQTRNTVPG